MASNELSHGPGGLETLCLTIFVAALAMVAARTEPHVGAPNWRPPYRTYWYDPWPLLTGQKSTILRFCGVSAPFAHPTTTLHHPPGGGHKPTERAFYTKERLL